MGNKKKSERPLAEYQCERCQYEFKSAEAGMVRCPKCNSNYVKWVNHQEFMDWVWENDPDYEWRK